MDKHHVEILLLEGERHFFQILPVSGPELLVGFEVVFLQVFFVAGPAVFEEAPLVVPQQRCRAGSTREVDRLAAVGAAVDQIPEKDEPVVAGGGKLLEQIGEFGVAAVDVADGNEPSVHAVGKC